MSIFDNCEILIFEDDNISYKKYPIIIILHNNIIYYIAYSNIHIIHKSHTNSLSRFLSRWVPRDKVDAKYYI